LCSLTHYKKGIYKKTEYIRVEGGTNMDILDFMFSDEDMMIYLLLI